MTELQIETIMETACGLCFYPTVACSQEWLDEKCELCPLAEKLESFGKETPNG